MNFIFFGSPEFAAIILEKIIGAGFVPAVAICNPDRPAGRKKIITPPPVKALIMRHGTWNIKILQPEQLNASFKFQVSSFKPELAIVAAYAKIISREVLDVFPKGVIGVHPSLLPKYRGTTPMQSAILSGEEETGVTLYLLDEKVDHGPIIANRKWQMANGDTYETLLKKLAEIGGKLFVETLPKFLAGEVKPAPQNEAGATYAKKFKTEDAFIEPGDLRAAQAGNRNLAVTIDRKIRALNPEPGVWTYTNEFANMRTGKDNTKRIKLLEASLSDGRLIIKKIQIEGKKPRNL